ncbi:AlpA family transcriptional regulator [Vibrio sp. VPAP30]|uniref:AlpA family transcriptional regulator n=1 Tax=Vibrio sp. VPAP30 TaxID=1647102 RepID=UPI0009E1F914|nr:AlpA family transcriptional regulator [Vibrio sp. VPAP30]
MRFIRLNEVKTKTSLSRSGIYRLINAGCFPVQVQIGERAVGWVESEIEEWLEGFQAGSELALNHDTRHFLDRLSNYQ